MMPSGIWSEPFPRIAAVQYCWDRGLSLTGLVSEADVAARERGLPYPHEVTLDEDDLMLWWNHRAPLRVPLTVEMRNRCRSRPHA